MKDKRLDSVTSPPPHLTSTSPHLHLTSPHLTSPPPHLTSPHLTSPHLTSTSTSPHLTSPHHLSLPFVHQYYLVRQILSVRCIVVVQVEEVVCKSEGRGEVVRADDGLKSGFEFKNVPSSYHLSERSVSFSLSPSPPSSVLPPLPPLSPLSVHTTGTTPVAKARQK